MSLATTNMPVMAAPAAESDSSARSSESAEDRKPRFPKDSLSFPASKRRHLASLLPGRPHSHHSQGSDYGIQPDRSASPSRPRTILASLRYLSSLTSKQIDDFLASYVIYSLDWADPVSMEAVLGPNYTERVGDSLRAYYGVLNHLCALGDVEKMYIPPVMDLAASVRDNQLLFEEAMAREIGFGRNQVESSGAAVHSTGPLRILDLGCGRGRVAAHVASYSRGRAVVTGLNIDPDQVAQARSFNLTHVHRHGQAGNTNTFVVHDFNTLPLPFPNEHFDALYEIQALSLCRDLPSLFRDLHRITKPGARISLLEWVALPAFDATNPEHAALMARVKPLIGAVGTPTPESVARDLERAGFRVVRNENASVTSHGFQWPLIERVDVYFRVLRRGVHLLVRAGILPKHFKVLVDRLCLDGEAFVEMDRKGLVTTSWWWVAERLD